MTQGDPVFPTLFNIIVDSLFRATLQDICGPQEDQQDFRWLVGEHKIFFYEDDRRIAGKYQIRVQVLISWRLTADRSTITSLQLMMA